MTDAQQLFHYARTQFDAISADIERHFDLVAGNLRERFSRPLSTPAPRRLPPPTLWQLCQRWMYRNKALTAALVTFFVSGSVGSFVYIKSSGSGKRRRARKASNGARCDVVVISGAVASPLTNALYLELERRGFVVYVVASTAEDEHFIRSHSRSDLLPLPLDLIDPFAAQNQILQFEKMLERDHVAFEGVEPHKMNFRGLVLVPDTQCTPARIEYISSEEWSDAFNAKVLNTIATTQLLLPVVIENKANVLFLTPSVTPALRLPMHALESTVYGSLQGFISSLAAELEQDDVRLCHLKLGSIDIPSVPVQQKRHDVQPPRLKPTPLRKLHDAVFDTLVGRIPRRTLYVGRGALAYDIISNLVPPSFIAWMMSAGQRPSIMRTTSDEEMHGSAGSLTWEKIEQDT